MDILKSSRHSKITGDFGETVVMYWLSKYNFECASVDHTGIDLIARNPYTSELRGTDKTSVSGRFPGDFEVLSVPLMTLHPLRANKRGEIKTAWKMTSKWLSMYYADPNIKVFEFTTATVQWW